MLFHKKSQTAIKILMIERFYLEMLRSGKTNHTQYGCDFVGIIDTTDPKRWRMAPET